MSYARTKSGAGRGQVDRGRGARRGSAGKCPFPKEKSNNKIRKKKMRRKQKADTTKKDERRKKSKRKGRSR